MNLNVRDIVVCGHSECGAMQALVKGIDTLCCPHLESWLKYGEESLRKVRGGFTLDDSLSEHNQLSQVNVLQQIEHISSYPFVRERLEKKTLRSTAGGLILQKPMSIATKRVLIGLSSSTKMKPNSSCSD